jgi:hypothetical protein
MLLQKSGLPALKSSATKRSRRLANAKCVTPQMRTIVFGEHILRALNKIKKPSTAEEITELLNRDLGPGDLPFQTKEVAS